MFICRCFSLLWNQVIVVECCGCNECMLSRGLLSGARLYFTVTKFGQLSSGLFTTGLSGMMSSSSRFCPSVLTLIHVRLPPGFTVGVQHRPTNVHSAFYQHGLSACLSILLILPAKAREYVFTAVGLSVCLSVCDHDN